MNALFGAIMGVAGEAAGKVVETGTAAGNTVGKAAGQTLSTAGNTVGKAAGQTLSTAGNTVGNAAGQTLSTAGNTVGNVAGKIGDAVPEGLSDAASGAANTMGNAVASGAEAAAAAAQTLKDSGITMPELPAGIDADLLKVNLGEGLNALKDLGVEEKN